MPLRMRHSSRLLGGIVREAGPGATARDPRTALPCASLDRRGIVVRFLEFDEERLPRPAASARIDAGMPGCASTDRSDARSMSSSAAAPAARERDDRRARVANRRERAGARCT